ncbi:predicted protein [Uncinocarpus reesii 1704]|uniref:Uncharacterized protein n=1 Tax=Uncinocarpus reesii (strain UAMH 1704) TaxID=336963 RepID=C4JWX9_UNCRE|nr:uncharacterized protein UREG_06152 [Uncinocarpus reesii 1704]EEP81287.1 predicted protein [Uncinocarpus reesii 1704]
MAQTFPRSTAVITELARTNAQTPPPTNNDWTYVDYSLRILGRSLDNHSQEMDRRHRHQMNLVVDQLRELPNIKRLDKMEQKIDEKFEAVDKRFEKVEKKMDERFEAVDKRFEGLEQELRDIKAQLANDKAMKANGLLRRLHQPINPIKVLKLIRSNEYEWRSHPKMPKHMKALFKLGQSAKEEAEILPPHRPQAALKTVRELAKFYEVVVYSDEQSESEATEVDVGVDPDAYMDMLLDKWGMDWSKVYIIKKPPFSYGNSSLQPRLDFGCIALA